MTDDLSSFADYNDGSTAITPFPEHPPVTPARLLDVPDKMYVELATGLEEAKDVATRYGFTEDEITAFLAFKPFQDRVAAHVSQLQAEGITTRYKARLLYDAVVEKLGVIALSDTSTAGQKLDIAEHLAKVGDLLPKQTQQQAVGAGFSININLPPLPPKTITVDNGA